MKLNAWILIPAMLLAGTACNRPASQPKKIAITTSSEKARAAFLKARELSENLRSAAAKPLLDEAIREDPNFAVALLLRAGTATTPSEYFERMKAAVAAAPKASEGEQLWIRASEAGARGNQKESGELFAKLVAAYPEDERARFSLSSYHYGVRNYEAAAAECRRAIQLAPNYAPAYNMLGYSLRETGNDKEAEAALRKYVELVPNEPNPQDSLAELLMKMGRFDDSIEAYRKALSLDPQFWGSHRGIAANLLFQDKHKEAMEQLQKAFEVASDDSERRRALREMAICHVDQGRVPAALDMISKATALDEKSGNHAGMAGDAGISAELLLHSGKIEQARRQFVLALEHVRQSNRPERSKKRAELGHHGTLALVAAARKDFETANKEAAIMRAGFEGWATPQEMFWLHEVLGILALQQKNYGEAISRLSQADPQSLYVMYHLGKAYAGKPDQEKALTWYRKAATTYTLPSLRDALVRKAAQRELGA